MKRIDLTSPVEILACQLPKKDYAACDLTLYNLTGDQVTSVEATLTLRDESGEEIARVIHRARSLDGAPGQAFIMTIPAENMTRAKEWEATVDKVWFDNSSIWRRARGGLTEYMPNDLKPSNALNNLRAVMGEDAVGYPAEQGALWLCVCGRPNDSQAEQCVRCGRKKADVFRYGSKEAVEEAVAKHESRLAEQGKQALQGSSDRQLKREEEHRAKVRKRVIAAVAVIVVLLLAGGAYIGMTRIAPQMKYQQAVEAFSNGEYQQAEEEFLALGDYSDSADYVLKCRYERALAQLKEDGAEQVAAAREAFVALGDFEDAAAMVTECDYREAVKLMDAGDREAAKEKFGELGGYQDSETMVKRLQYMDAEDLLAEGEYEQARAIFAELSEYEDAASRVQETWYHQAEAALDAGDVEAALACLEEIPGYAEADQLVKRAHYMRATALREAEDIDAAAEEFALAGDYEDAVQQASVSFYAPAQAALEAGQYDRAAELFSRIRGYEDADEKWTVATYEAAKRAIKDLEYNRASMLLSELPEDYEDVPDLRKECAYRPALAAYERGEYEMALQAFEQLGDYSDAQEQAQKSRYAIAQALFEQGDVAGAIEQYGALGDYSDAEKQLQAVKYVQASDYLALGTEAGYQQAIDTFEALGDYSDSADKLKQARFGQADLMLAAGDVAGARAIFEGLGDFGEAARRVKACDYARAEALYADGRLTEAAELYLELGNYEDAQNRAHGIWYEMGEQAAKAGNTLDAARYYGQAGNYEDAQAQMDALYDVYYGDTATLAQQAYDTGSYVECVAVLKTLDMTELPPKYASLTPLYEAACYEAGNQLFDAGDPYGAFPYYQEVSDRRTVRDRLQRSCYLILGTWVDLNGTVYTFSEDGTLTIGDETLYFAVDGTTLRTGASPDALSDTHRLTGVTQRNAWLFDGRSGTEITIYLTKDEAAAAALAEAAAQSAVGTIPLPEEE